MLSCDVRAVSSTMSATMTCLTALYRDQVLLSACMQHMDAFAIVALLSMNIYCDMHVYI